MSETNLKDYFSRIQALLDQNAADEVIHHCRHILLYFPKNVAVYRFLGRALVVIGRLDEAEAALRRVLSVVPDDFEAHVLLGEVYERTKNCEDAIWHLERALDQRPSEKSVIDALRVLNHRCRKSTQGKIQMTAGAVARQYMRAGDTDRALETLRSTLKNSPDRVDLQLLLARILWTSGRHEDAAEIALEVVDSLPDCLDANRILAELWLSYDRPSDAQHYVNRIESVEPYMAVEIVQGAPPDDDTFRIEELDFRRSAQSEAVATRPDWLKEIGAAAPSGAEPGDTDDEWSTWSSGMLASSAASPPSAQPSPRGAAGEELDWLSAFPMRESDSSDDDLPDDDLFSGDVPQFDSRGVNTGDLEALFGSSSEPPPAVLPASPSAKAPTTGSDSEGFDPFAWAQESGIEFIEEPEEKEFADLFADDAGEPVLDMEPDPLAWMTQYTSNTASDEPEYNRDVDLFQRDSLPGAPVYDPYTAEGDDDEPAFGHGVQDNALEELDWLITPPTRSRYSDPEVEPEAEQDVPAQPSEPTSQGKMRGLTSFLSEASPDWLQSSESSSAPVVSDQELDDWLNQFGATPPAKSEEPSTPDWLDTLNEPAKLAEPVAQIPAADSFAATFEQQDEELEWMSESERPQDQAQPEDSGLPDWLSDLNPEGAAAACGRVRDRR
ncbi:MAG: tetratricopeptide repeat protein [Chloroflexi bacterium]|nr:tetratricopeptide repeat protein [Chloroflexota bacterium]